MIDLTALMTRMAACRVCEGKIPEPNPVFQLSATARLIVIGQAPGTKVHASGIPWNDLSGDTLRRWMGLDREAFYDRSRVELVLLVGSYAHKYYLKASGSVTDTVGRWATFGPRFFPVVHPSPRNKRWLKTNPWFEDEVVPALRQRIQEL